MKIVKELKTLILLHKIEKKMRRTKFDPEAAKSILVFKLAPITQFANSLFKFKSEDLQLSQKSWKNNYEGNFFQLPHSHPEQPLC